MKLILKRIKKACVPQIEKDWENSIFFFLLYSKQPEFYFGQSSKMLSVLGNIHKYWVFCGSVHKEMKKKKSQNNEYCFI